MIGNMVWVVTDTEEGWGCTLCDWIIATPEIDTTVAALKYNRIAQKNFDTHECRQNGNGAKKPLTGSLSCAARTPVITDPKSES